VESNAGRFQSPPVGPLGAYVELADASKDRKWITALEVALPFKVLQRWIVGSMRDKDALLDLADKVGCRQELCVVVQTPRVVRHEPVDLLQRYPERVQATVLSVLKIQNDRAFNAFLDLSSIESTCLYESKRDAERGALEGSRGDRFDALKGVSKILLANGDETGARNGSLFYRRHGRRGQHSLAAVLDGADGSSSLPGAKRALEAAQRAADDARDEVDRFEGSEKRDAERAVKAAKAACTTAQKKVDDLEKKVRAARRDLDEKRAERDQRDADVQDNEEEVALKQQETEFEEDVASLESHIAAAKLEVDAAKRDYDAHADTVLAPLETRKKQHEDRNASMKEEMEVVEREMAELIQDQDDDKKKVANALKKKEKASSKVSEHERAVAAEVQRVNEVTAKAEQASRQFLGDSWDGKPSRHAGRFKSENAVMSKIKALEGAKDRALKNKDISERDPEIAKQKMERAAAAYRGKERGCKQIEKEGRDLLQDSNDRWEKLKAIRKTICRRTNNNFDTILQKKGASGALSFNHKETTLGVTFQKDNADTSTQLHNVVSLSGGERSFTTLAMLLAVGDNIDSPFRLMDEFDVFMDQVARKVAMKELVEMAKTKADKQFIFITPQDLSSLPQSDILKIFKLHPPLRGQQTLNFGSAAQSQAL